MSMAIEMEMGHVSRSRDQTAFGSTPLVPVLAAMVTAIKTAVGP